MNAFLTASLCLCVLAVLSDGVTVKVGEFSFPLESVKKLKDLPDVNPASRARKAVSLCDNPNLPMEFQIICTKPDSGPLLEQLGSIARESEICEICANIACSGC